MDFLKHVESLEMRLDLILEKAEIWQKIFDEAPLAIAVFDLDMKFYLVNQSFCDLTGYTAGELSDLPLATVLPKKFKRMHKQKEKEFALNPQKKVNRHGLSPQIALKSGEEVDIDIDLSYFFNGNKAYYVAFIKPL